MKVVALLLALMCMFGIGYRYGQKIKQGEWDADRLKLQNAAIQLKEAWNADIAQQKQAQADEVAGINARLADALERVRKRPERLPEPARATCEGATGSELSRPDATFLEREAARADEQRAALSACYQWINTVKGTHEILRPDSIRHASPD